MICAHELHFGEFLRNPVSMSVLIENIRHLFDRFGATQAAFGDKFDVSQGTVSRWLKGSTPEPEHTQALASYAGVSFEQFRTVPHEQWGARVIGVPSVKALAELILDAQMEMEPGLPPHEWPRAFAGALHERLARFADEAAKPRIEDDQSDGGFGEGDGPQLPTT